MASSRSFSHSFPSSLAVAVGAFSLQVKGTVTHPALEILCMLEARVLSLKRGKFFITLGLSECSRRQGSEGQSVSQSSPETGTPLPPTRHDLVVTFARHNRSLPRLNGALGTAPAAARLRRPHAGPNIQKARGSAEARAEALRPWAQLPGGPGPGPHRTEGSRRSSRNSSRRSAGPCQSSRNFESSSSGSAPTAASSAPAPAAFSERAEREESSSFRCQAMTTPDPWPPASPNTRGWSGWRCICGKTP